MINKLASIFFLIAFFLIAFFVFALLGSLYIDYMQNQDIRIMFILLIFTFLSVMVSISAFKTLKNDVKNAFNK